MRQQSLMHNQSKLIESDFIAEDESQLIADPSLDSTKIKLPRDLSSVDADEVRSHDRVPAKNTNIFSFQGSFDGNHYSPASPKHNSETDNDPVVDIAH